MKKSKIEAAETRRRIVKTAAAEFRRKGINGAGVNDVMAAAGLTHGGFYRHFDSKDELVADKPVPGAWQGWPRSDLGRLSLDGSSGQSVGGLRASWAGKRAGAKR